MLKWEGAYREGEGGIGSGSEWVVFPFHCSASKVAGWLQLGIYVMAINLRRLLFLKKIIAANRCADIHISTFCSFIVIDIRLNVSIRYLCIASIEWRAFTMHHPHHPWQIRFHWILFFPPSFLFHNSLARISQVCHKFIACLNESHGQFSSFHWICVKKN